MYLRENPVLQRELLVNLRMHRGFFLLFAYVALLGVVVFAAWPSDTRLDLTEGGRAILGQQTGAPGTRLVNLFFLGQYVLMAMMAPSFAAGAITGEKERKTYEMLLASPMRPTAVVLGKLIASLGHLAVLVFASLPIVMLCLPLGGVSPWEVLATYVAMGASIVLFGMISLTASSYFSRTIAALLVSYMAILPLALLGVLFYAAFAAAPVFRLIVFCGFVPLGCAGICAGLMGATARRLMHPPDVGSQGSDVVDLEREQREAVGMIIRSNQFPDRLFAPPKRTELLDDGVNPVYDKEMRSELFSQGSLMLRLVIQVSMFLALFVMAGCLYIKTDLAALYTCYVVLFNLMVGPVFSAGAITSERERQTLELLLTTTLSPWKILSAKLYSSLRISCVLTSFLVWPIVLSWILPPWTYLKHTPTVLGYLAIIAVVSLTTTTLAMFCSVLFRKTSTSMMTAYLVAMVLFTVPVAAKWFAEIYMPGTAAIEWTAHFAFTSPFAAALSLPLSDAEGKLLANTWGAWTCVKFLVFYVALDGLMIWAMIRLFHARWRVSVAR
ncbi:MAG TPA: ABC transporter permease subunit [Thermoguttaceae bacterium]|nr:ABC transporter permease subunit [Thermoguttaceae bacterium]